MSTEVLTGIFIVERHVFQGDVPGERTIIGTLDDDTTVKGKADRDELEPGGTYRFSGTWSNHPHWGRQFHFSSFTPATPLTHRGIQLYLRRCKGIGPRWARQIVDVYGEEALSILRKEPGRVAAAISGLSPEAAEAAAARLREDAATEATMVELLDLLATRGFPSKLPKEVFRRFGARAPAAIRENPYILMAFRGVGFLKADRLYLALGLDPAAVERQGWCLWHATQVDSEGHVWFPLDVAAQHLRASVSGADVDARAALAWARDNDKLVSRESSGRVWIADARLAAHEAAVVECLRKAEMEGSEWPEPIERTAS